MLLSLLKTDLFTAFVLLVGQIPIRQKTIGDRFEALVARSLSKGVHQVDHWRVQAGLGGIAFLKQRVEHETTKAVAKVEPEIEEEDSELAPSDRESILRLLQ